MENNKRLYKSLCNYFTSLKYFGYKKQSDVDKLLIYCFLVELLTGDLSCFITEEDYRQISRALYNLYGTTCLIPYPKFKEGTSLFGTMSLNTLRITEDTSVRFTEDNNVRVVT